MRWCDAQGWGVEKGKVGLLIHPPTHLYLLSQPTHPPTPPQGITPCFAQSIFALGPLLFFLIAGPYHYILLLDATDGRRLLDKRLGKSSTHPPGGTQ